MNVHCNVSHNSPKLETDQCPSAAKQVNCGIYSMVYFLAIKRNMDASQKHYAEEKEPDTRVHAV